MISHPLLTNKTATAITLYETLLHVFHATGPVRIEPTKTMIGISNERKRIAWVTQVGKNFVHVVFPFKQPYNDNLCFQKIAQVSGDAQQFNHHFRMYSIEDLNEEVRSFMRLAYNNEEV